MCSASCAATTGGAAGLCAHRGDRRFVGGVRPGAAGLCAHRGDRGIFGVVRPSGVARRFHALACGLALAIRGEANARCAASRPVSRYAEMDVFIQSSTNPVESAVGVSQNGVNFTGGYPGAFDGDGAAQEPRRTGYSRAWGRPHYCRRGRRIDRASTAHQQG